MNGASTLKADATGNGNGGEVVVWSEQSASFRGSVSAKGGVAGGDGGVLEVSGKEQLTFGGRGDASAPKGTPGSLLLDPKNIVIDATVNAIGYGLTQLVDPNPGVGDQFAQAAVVLGNLNVVATDPFDDAIATDGGATYLFNGASGALESTLSGTFTNDRVGSGGVTELDNGNYVVVSSGWGDTGLGPRGAVTWGSASSGVSGAVSAANSLVGANSNDRVGSGGITALITNGNYVVASPDWANGSQTLTGAVTWGNGSSGISGVVSAANSLIGANPDDQVGSGGVTELTNGNYVVASPFFNTAAGSLGAVTWGSGTTGISGLATSANSLVGGSGGDQVGSGGVTALSNGNYVVASPLWDNLTIFNAGAVTWGNGSLGTSGLVTTGNSLVGGTPNDQVGNSGVTALTSNGNYVVLSPNWSRPGAASAGAVTWRDGGAATAASVQTLNSLVGTTTNDQIGSAGVAALSNGNYVVASPRWDNLSSSSTDAGAATWGEGTIGISGAVSTDNSLVGAVTSDLVAQGGVTALTNGNYVVNSYSWRGSDGAVTWGDGSTGTTGTVSITNSLVGPLSGGDTVGLGPDFDGSGGVIALSNGNYVVNSPLWGTGSLGAVTWGDGSIGSVGEVGATNSLVGVTGGDQVGSGGIQTLTNGNYVVSSPQWNNGAVGNAGAVSWGDGTTGTSGLVSSSNSLVGSTSGDQVGFGSVTALSNGNYVVLNSIWDNGPASNVGAVTWGMEQRESAGRWELTIPCWAHPFRPSVKVSFANGRMIALCSVVPMIPRPSRSRENCSWSRPMPASTPPASPAFPGSTSASALS